MAARSLSNFFTEFRFLSASVFEVRFHQIDFKEVFYLHENGTNLALVMIRSNSQTFLKGTNMKNTGYFVRTACALAIALSAGGAWDE